MSPIAKANAIQVIAKYNLKEPGEYSLEKILNAEGLLLETAALDGCIGMIQYSSEYGIVTISGDLKSTGRKNFTIAHELGHFCNEKKVFRRCTAEDVYGISNNRRFETEANDFAAEFLMHEPWFVDFTQGKSLNRTLLSEAAEYFKVSLTSAAIRYAEIGSIPCAVIMSVDGRVKWKVISPEFKFQFLQTGTKVSDLSYTSDFFAGKGIPDQEDIPARAWFPDDYKLTNIEERIMEMNIPMPRYNAVMTVLWEI